MVKASTAKNVTVYGIKNCDTMKKAFQWLDKHNVSYVFHDYKKQGVDEAVLGRALKKHGWKEVLNCKGTTWRNLPERTKTAMDDREALKTALENPSVIRRPLITVGENIYSGFDAENFKKIFGP